MISNILIARLAVSFPTPYPQFKSSVLQRNTFLFFNSLASQPPQHQKDDSFTVSYLTTSCGLPPETAARVSKKVNLTTSDKTNAVIVLLKNYGFSETQIAKYVQKRPSVLLVNAEKTLLPKLKFFHSIGVSSIDLPKIVLHDSAMLARSLDKCIIPRYKVLKSVVRNDQEVVRALKGGALSFFYCDVVSNLVPNMNVLRECGVPQASISHLVMFHPSSSSVEHLRFVEAVKLTKEIGFDPSKVSFVSAIHVLIHLGRARWELRLEAFKKWGWSREISVIAFRKCPNFMTYTEERITKSMNFLVNEMGWSSEDIAKFPVALAYNMEKRIIPRCQIIKILKLKGLVKVDLSLAAFVCITEQLFLKRFVTKFLEDVPLLLDVYRGLIDHQDLL